MYIATEDEIKRLKKGILAAFATPFVDDIEDYVWEAIFTYVKNVSLVDTLTNTRAKLLFDVVDNTQLIGWSAKALRCSIYPLCQFELVIQRADIIKKQYQLGFSSLSLQSHPNELGTALLRHWYQGKVYPDAIVQNVTHKRICILLKSRNLKQFALFEEDLAEYVPEELDWQWTDETQTGLQGIRKADGFCVFRWYPNQKQFFERFILPENAPIFELTPRRLPLGFSIDLLGQALDNLEY